MLYPDPDSRSKAMFERAKASLPGGNTRSTVYMKPYQIYASHGEGCRVVDLDGTARIDCINNFTALAHGHAHPHIVEAGCEQIRRGSAPGLPTVSEVELAEVLTARVASVDQVRFSNSGTEAIMMALKATRAFTGRPKIAKVEGAYHGSYDYAEVSLETKPEHWTQGAPLSVAYAKGTPQGVLDDVVTIPFNDVDGAVSIVRAHGPELACVLIDPLPNRAGLIPADRNYIQAIREVTHEIGALLVFDEVISFRLGHAGAQPIWGVEADLTAFGKIIGGGFPVGATGGKTEFMTVFDPTGGKPALPAGGTFSANPLTMAGGIATMELLDHEAFQRLDEIGERVRQGINEIFRQRGVSGGAVGMGSLLKIHFTDRPLRDYRSTLPSAVEAARAADFFKALLNEGVLMAGYGLMALSTPMSNDDVAEILSGVSVALAKAA